MKNYILLLLFLASGLVVNAQQPIQKMILANNEYQLSFNDDFHSTPGHQPNDHKEPYYPVPANNDELPDEGWSYFWYTSDGQTSTLEHPKFYFATANPTVTIVMTPRKKGSDKKKAVYSQTLTVTPNAASIVPTTNANPWSDHPPRSGDSVYISFPLNKCYPNLHTFDGYLDFDQGLVFKRFLPFDETINSVTAPSGVRVDFDFDWNSSLNNMQVVAVFEVMAAHNIPVFCNWGYDASSDSSKCNAPLEYSAIAKDLPYDPNFIKPSLGSDLDSCDIGGKWITYNLQFQNEGGADTRYISLLIDLDHQLEANTIQFLACSTNLKQSVSDVKYDSNTLALDYFNIQNSSLDVGSYYVFGLEMDTMVLQPMSTNYANSIGYVSFKVRVKEGVILAPGERLVTKSEVIFGYNDVVHTNEAITSCKATRKPDTCNGTETCTCPNCCEKPWYEKYGWWIGAAVILLLVVYRFIKRNKP